MAKDPAVLFYWSDWFGGTFTMSRHQKGCYMDLLYAQFNEGHLSLDAIKTVLGSDFSVWNTIQKKFKEDANGLWFNQRLEDEVVKRGKHKVKQSENATKRYQTSAKPPANNVPLEDVNENTHSVFALRLLSNEGELDKEAIEISTKTIVTQQLLKEFNANLKNQNKHYSHFSEYKKHLVNWIPKKPKQQANGNTPTGKKLGRISEDSIREFIEQNSEQDSERERRA